MSRSGAEGLGRASAHVDAVQMEWRARSRGSQSVRTIPTAIVATAATLIALGVRRDVTLREDSVVLPVTPEHALAQMRARFTSGPDVIAADADCLVRRFSGRAGPYSYRTVELVTFEPESITFEHLRGPFVTCHERFELSRTSLGARLTHSGSFRVRGGLWTLALAAGPIRRAFEEHVGEHLEHLRAELTRVARPLTDS